MKPIYCLFITNRVAANLWDDKARFDDIFSYLKRCASKYVLKPGKRKNKVKEFKLPLKNRYALWIYARAQKYLHSEYQRSEGVKEVDLDTFEDWYFAKYINKIHERRKKHEKAFEEIEG